ARDGVGRVAADDARRPHRRSSGDLGRHPVGTGRVERAGVAAPRTHVGGATALHAGVPGEQHAQPRAAAPRISAPARRRADAIGKPDSRRWRTLPERGLRRGADRTWPAARARAGRRGEPAQDRAGRRSWNGAVVTAQRTVAPPSTAITWP